MRDVRMRGFRERASVEDALQTLRGHVEPLPSEPIDLQAAAGRVASHPIGSKVDVPHFRRSAMDGYAVVGESTFGASTSAPVILEVVGRSRPGSSFTGQMSAGQAVSIATGAPIPDGADAVLMAEYSIDRGATVAVTQAVPPQKHIGQVGEDIVRGAVVVPSGRRLRPQDVGLLASIGVACVDVFRRPRVVILITGDELLAPGTMPTGAKIVDANSLMLEALAERDGAANVIIKYVRDDPKAIAAALLETACDVLLVSGGSSVGPEDHAPGLVAEHGQLWVHGVAIRPSGPAGFGQIADHLVFLLPGNPVSCLCAYEFFAGPAIRRLGGRSMSWPHQKKRLALAQKITSVLGRTDYVRVAIEQDRVIPIMTSGASILSSTTRADGVVLVRPEHEGYDMGELVDVLLYD